MGCVLSQRPLISTLPLLWERRRENEGGEEKRALKALITTYEEDRQRMKCLDVRINHLTDWKVQNRPPRMSSLKKKHLSNWMLATSEQLSLFIRLSPTKWTMNVHMQEHHHWISYVQHEEHALCVGPRVHTCGWIANVCLFEDRKPTCYLTAHATEQSSINYVRNTLFKRVLYRPREMVTKRHQELGESEEGKKTKAGRSLCFTGSVGAYTSAGEKVRICLDLDWRINYFPAAAITIHWILVCIYLFSKTQESGCFWKVTLFGTLIEIVLTK